MHTRTQFLVMLGRPGWQAQGKAKSQYQSILCLFVIQNQDPWTNWTTRPRPVRLSIPRFRRPELPVICLGYVAGIVREAFDKWSAVSPLSFVKVDRDKNADIRIEWAHGEHGDGNPFDGIGRVLAHAYFPPPTGSRRFDRLAGDAHFDEADRWTTGLLESVDVHEFGHSLGLDHSDVPNSVMYPFANGVTALTAADIDAIHKVYGPRRRTS
ncbi:Matrixin-domain-containing protein [Lipomyces orientalis]|uniref:Matrixin-domain-containing protein n=1 Tax=Lipomyces orientalis TaxID=1233043 RepID=A0ACC3TLN4_9ASCO